jgi:hypothetical protein
MHVTINVKYETALRIWEILSEMKTSLFEQILTLKYIYFFKKHVSELGTLQSVRYQGTLGLIHLKRHYLSMLSISFLLFFFIRATNARLEQRR